MPVVVLNAWSIFIKGGPMMWPILALSVIVLTVVIEKWMSLAVIRRQWPSKREAIFSFVKASQFKQAADSCDAAKSFYGRVLKAGILKYGASRESILTVMQQALMVEANEIKQRMGLLAVIVNLAPLLGLLATMVGFTVVFQAIHIRSNALNPLPLGDMASGIWQALIASSVGLAVGLMAYVAHAFLASQINDLLIEAEDNMIQLANTLNALWEGEAHADQ